MVYLSFTCFLWSYTFDIINENINFSFLVSPYIQLYFSKKGYTLNLDNFGENVENESYFMHEGWYSNLIYIKVRIFIAKWHYSLKFQRMHKLISLTWWKFHWKHLTTLAKKINRKPFWLFGQAAHLKVF